MKSPLFKNYLALLFGVLALATAGCGKSSNNAQGVGSATVANCAPGQGWNGLACVNGGIYTDPTGGIGGGGNLLSQCSAYGGTLVSGGTVCQFGAIFYLNTGWIPRVDSKDRNESPMAKTGFTLKAGDRIKLTEMFPGTSRYGTGGSCDTSLAGNSDIRGQYPRGALLARVGSEYFDLADNAGHIVSGSGDLKIGYNLDVPLFLGLATDKSGCTSLINGWVNVSSCRDNYGNSIACP